MSNSSSSSDQQVPTHAGRSPCEFLAYYFANSSGQLAVDDFERGLCTECAQLWRDFVHKHGGAFAVSPVGIADPQGAPKEQVRKYIKLTVAHVTWTHGVGLTVDYHVFGKDEDDCGVFADWIEAYYRAGPYPDIARQSFEPVNWYCKLSKDKLLRLFRSVNWWNNSDLMYFWAGGGDEFSPPAETPDFLLTRDVFTQKSPRKRGRHGQEAFLIDGRVRIAEPPAAMARTYIADIAGGTATVTIQCQATQTLKSATFSWTPAAAGKYELSYSSTSQIGTAQPDANVIARVNIGVLTSGGAAAVQMPINMPVKAFQSIYVHCTGAGNLGTVTLS